MTLGISANTDTSVRKYHPWKLYQPFLLKLQFYKKCVSWPSPGSGKNLMFCFFSAHSLRSRSLTVFVVTSIYFYSDLLWPYCVMAAFNVVAYFLDCMLIFISVFLAFKVQCSLVGHVKLLVFEIVNFQLKLRSNTTFWTF